MPPLESHAEHQNNSWHIACFCWLEYTSHIAMTDWFQIPEKMTYLCNPCSSVSQL